MSTQEFTSPHSALSALGITGSLSKSLKIELFKVQMVCRIVDQNAIGIVGCMRPHLEHRAIADSKLRLNECS